MSVGACACMGVHVSVCTCMYSGYVSMCACMYGGTCACVCVIYGGTCLCVYMYGGTCPCVCARVGTCVCVFACTYRGMRLCVCVHVWGVHVSVSVRVFVYMCVHTSKCVTFILEKITNGIFQN